MDEKTIFWLKVGLIVITFGFSTWAFVRGELLIGFLVLVVAVIFLFFGFLKEKFQPEAKPLEELIKDSLLYLNNEFKITVGEGKNFDLHSHAPFGEKEYKLVFIKKDDFGVPQYYPVTVDKFTGRFGELTGTSTDKKSEAEYFLNKKPGANSSPGVSLQNIQDLMEEQREAFRREKCNRKGGVCK